MLHKKKKKQTVWSNDPFNLRAIAWQKLSPKQNKEKNTPVFHIFLFQGRSSVCNSIQNFIFYTECLGSPRASYGPNFVWLNLIAYMQILVKYCELYVTKTRERRFITVSKA